MKRDMEILLVEDSPDDVVLFREALKDTNIPYSLSVAEDGEEALAYLKQQGKHAKAGRPDVIVLDLNLPKKDGHAVLEEIKSDPVLEQIPVVMLTVSSAQQDVVKAMELKMNYYLNKPVDYKSLGRLLDTIESLWEFEVRK